MLFPKQKLGRPLELTASVPATPTLLILYIVTIFKSVLRLSLYYIMEDHQSYPDSQTRHTQAIPSKLNNNIQTVLETIHLKTPLSETIHSLEGPNGLSSLALGRDIPRSNNWSTIVYCHARQCSKLPHEVDHLPSLITTPQTEKESPVSLSMCIILERIQVSTESFCACRKLTFLTNHILNASGSYKQLTKSSMSPHNKWSNTNH